MLLFFISFFVVFGLANFYVARRVWQGTEILPRSFRISLTVLFIFSAASYPAARGLLSFNNFLYDLILGIGAVHFVNLLYAFLYVGLLDLIRLALIWKSHPFRSNRASYLKLKGYLSLSGAVMIISLVVLGHLNTLNIKVKYADFELPGRTGESKSYKILLFSDSHFSSLNSGKFLDNLIQKINEINPDIILMAGDVIDDKPSVLFRTNVTRISSEIQPPKGIYMCHGNHEYIVGINEAEKFLDTVNFNLLKDDYVIIDSTFIIAGRDDSAKSRFIGLHRNSLKDVIAPLKDLKLPIILLDHQPFNLSEVAAEGVFFQFSGHTHNGQFFPINIITNLIYELSWGYKKIHNTHFYVTSGVGTWGPPIRIGSDSELIVLNLRFR